MTIQLSYLRDLLTDWKQDKQTTRLLTFFENLSQGISVSICIDEYLNPIQEVLTCVLLKDLGAREVTIINIAER